MRKDAVTPEVREAVLKRDRECFLTLLDGDAHTCSGRMTVDHVHDVAGGVKGKRARSDENHMVAMCADGNVGGPSRRVRIAERVYLKEIQEHGNWYLAVLRCIVAADEYEEAFPGRHLG